MIKIITKAHKATVNKAGEVVLKDQGTVIPELDKKMGEDSTKIVEYAQEINEDNNKTKALVKMGKKPGQIFTINIKYLA